MDAGIHWLIEASQSTPKAALRLGEIYRRGEIVPKDVGKAVEWFTKATQFISSALKAKKTLGAMYASGELGAIDINISSKWYSEVVEICNKKLNEGLPNPSEYAYELAELYENGTEVRKDKERATNLYMQAANLKHSKAIKRLEELGINWKNS